MILFQKDTKFSNKQGVRAMASVHLRLGMSYMTGPETRSVANKGRNRFIVEVFKDKKYAATAALGPP